MTEGACYKPRAAGTSTHLDQRRVSAVNLRIGNRRGVGGRGGRVRGCRGRGCRGVRGGLGQRRGPELLLQLVPELGRNQGGLESLVQGRPRLPRASCGKGIALKYFRMRLSLRTWSSRRTNVGKVWAKMKIPTLHICQVSIFNFHTNYQWILNY